MMPGEGLCSFPRELTDPESQSSGEPGTSHHLWNVRNTREHGGWPDPNAHRASGWRWRPSPLLRNGSHHTAPHISLPGGSRGETRHSRGMRLILPQGEALTMGRDAQPAHGEGQQIPSPEVYALCLRPEAPHSASRTLGRSREHPGVLHADAKTGGSELAKSSESRLSLSRMPLNPGGRNICATCSAPAATMMHQEFGVSDWWCHPRGCDRRGTCSSLPPPRSCTPYSSPPPTCHSPAHAGLCLSAFGSYLPLVHMLFASRGCGWAFPVPKDRSLPCAGTKECLCYLLRNIRGGVNC